jgi:hypothetical protein
MFEITNSKMKLYVKPSLHQSCIYDKTQLSSYMSANFKWLHIEYILKPY